jgi:hypothetical protein
VEQTGSESTFHRLESQSLAAWLENYSLGELWQKTSSEADCLIDEPSKSKLDCRGSDGGDVCSQSAQASPLRAQR